MSGATVNKRTPDQIARDRVFIADRYCRGERQADIAAALGVSQQQVSYDLAAIRRVWQQQMTATLDAHKAAQLARIDTLEREYWAEYARSKQPYTKTVQHAESNKGKDGKPAATRAIKTTEERTGDARYLAGVQWCISERCKILGLYAPLRVDIAQIVDETAAAHGLTEVERDELHASIAAHLAAAQRVSG